MFLLESVEIRPGEVEALKSERLPLSLFSPIPSRKLLDRRQHAVTCVVHGPRAVRRTLGSGERRGFGWHRLCAMALDAPNDCHGTGRVRGETTLCEHFETAFW